MIISAAEVPVLVRMVDALPAPIKETVLVAEVLLICPRTTCSVYVPGAILNTIGPWMPQASAVAASENVWKLDPPVTRDRSIVYVPAGNPGLTETRTGKEYVVLVPQVTAHL